MAFYINPVKKFADSVVFTKPPYKGRYPQNIRDSLFVHKMFKNGMAQVENEPGENLYDRCYVFSDTNYINKNNDEKQSVLLNLMTFLKSMSASYKITVANEYQDMDKFISDIFNDMNSAEYPLVSAGIKRWIDEKIEDAKLHDLKRMLYLTITVKSPTYDEARSYFLAMDSELDTMFKAMKSFIVPLDGIKRLNVLRNFFYQEEKEEYSFDDDVLYDVIPFSGETGFRDFMLFNNDRYVSVLFAREFDMSLNEGNLIHTISDTSYQSFVTIDYAPVEHAVTKEMLKSKYGNNELSIAKEADLKKSNNQAVTGISYSKEKKRAELESYMDELDDEDEECIQAGLLVAVTASSEDELALRIDEMKRKARKTGVTLDTYNYVQLKAFNTALPTGVRMVKNMRPFYTGSLVAMQPFYSTDITEPGGFVMGVNKTTKNLVFANRKKLKSPHGCIVGPTGLGKSFFIKMTEITQTLLSTDDDLQVIDPQNETKTVAALYGGLFLDFTPKSKIHINPMEIPQEMFDAGMTGKKVFVSAVTDWACCFVEAAMYNTTFTQEHMTFIGRAVESVYNSIFEAGAKRQPTIKDVRKELLVMEEKSDNQYDINIIHSVILTLEVYTEGVYDMFAYESDIDISTNRFVCFGLKNVPPKNWQPVMVSIMFFLSQRMNYNQELQKATRLIVDETQVVTKQQSSSEILLEAIRTYRKFGGIVTLALQNLTSALENHNLRDMLQNCGYKMFFPQTGLDAANLLKIQPLSEKEFDTLSDDNPGTSIMCWGKKVVILDSLMREDNPLYEVFSTDFHEKAAKAKRDAVNED